MIQQTGYSWRIEGGEVVYFVNKFAASESSSPAACRVTFRKLAGRSSLCPRKTAGSKNFGLCVLFIGSRSGTLGLLQRSLRKKNKHLRRAVSKMAYSAFCSKRKLSFFLRKSGNFRNPVVRYPPERCRACVLRDHHELSTSSLKSES